MGTYIAKFLYLLCITVLGAATLQSPTETYRMRIRVLGQGALLKVKESIKPPCTCSPLFRGPPKGGPIPRKTFKNTVLKRPSWFSTSGKLRNIHIQAGAMLLEDLGIRIVR